MALSNHDRNVSLICPTCAGKEFAFDEAKTEDSDTIRCTGCDREMTRKELLDLNSEIISAQVDEFKQEVMDDVKKEIQKTLKKSFGNSNSINFKL